MSALISAVIAFFVALGGYFYYDNYISSAPTPATTTEKSETSAPPLPDTSLMKSLDRSRQNLTQLPRDILSMTALQVLDLSHNQITGALPAEMRNLSNLEVLNVSNNRMTGLPAELGQLAKLRILNASNNQLTGIPHELGNLQNLEILDLSGNTISEQDLNVIRSRLPATTKIIL